MALHSATSRVRACRSPRSQSAMWLTVGTRAPDVEPRRGAALDGSRARGDVGGGALTRTLLPAFRLGRDRETRSVRAGHTCLASGDRRRARSREHDGVFCPGGYCLLGSTPTGLRLGARSRPPSCPDAALVTGTGPGPARGRGAAPDTFAMEAVLRTAGARGRSPSPRVPTPSTPPAGARLLQLRRRRRRRDDARVGVGGVRIQGDAHRPAGGEGLSSSARRLRAGGAPSASPGDLGSDRRRDGARLRAVSAGRAPRADG